MDAGTVPHTSAWSPWTSSALALVWPWRSPRRRRPPTKLDAAAAQPAFFHACAPAADVENRVKIMLKLLGEEADSFGKRADMYYRRRPEVINHVEDVYRAYRALVERYDHLSKELHKANHTIATACPEEVQYAMLEEEDDNFPRAIMPIYNLAIYLLNINHLVTGKERLKNIHISPRNELLLYPVD